MLLSFIIHNLGAAVVNFFSFSTHTCFFLMINWSLEPWDSHVRAHFVAGSASNRVCYEFKFKVRHLIQSILISEHLINPINSKCSCFSPKFCIEDLRLSDSLILESILLVKNQCDLSKIGFRLGIFR